MKFHEIANIFPMMTGQDYIDLREDIRVNGLLDPIMLYDGKILDGRNRYTACLDIGIEPIYEQWENNSNPLDYVISKNLRRRHLNETQRAVVASKLANMNLGDNQYGSANWQTHSVSQSKAAAMLNVSPRTVASVKAIERDAPELLSKLENGEMSAHEASKKIKEQKRHESIVQQKQAIQSGTAKLPEGLFEIIAMDPPWPYGTEYDPDGRRAANPYPEMSLDEIRAIKIPATDDCTLWLWTTHKFMRYSFDLLDAWGFRDVAIVTWEKDRMGLGLWLRSKSEFCIMAVKGKPLINLTNQTTVIHGSMREHSRKPDEFYQMVDSLCIGRKLDYFSREKREGWELFGNDTGHF